MKKNNQSLLMEQTGVCRWSVSRNTRADMQTDGMIYAHESLIPLILADNVVQQVINVACLPGIVGNSMAMPDIHWGYGFPIGGVAAFDINDGVVSPGGVGYDINCGVRLLSSQLTAKDIKGKENHIAKALFQKIPCGVGSEGVLRLSDKDLTKVLSIGAKWVVQNGYGETDDLLFTESNGYLPEADPLAVGNRPRERGTPQLGTLGSGNHFIEIGIVDEVFESEAAAVFGLTQGSLTLMIHSGSRGLGHQICEDYLSILGKAVARYGIHLPDRQLAAVPIKCPEGESYIAAMSAAANYAWANRQLLAYLAKTALAEALRMTPKQMGFCQVYDVAHNIAKFEIHQFQGNERRLLVHRKGATRALPAGHGDLPEAYSSVGQPILVPGDMGTASYVLVGTKQGAEETFSSACHGAGRRLSRSAAIKLGRGRNISSELGKRGVVVLARDSDTLAEEMPEAYKDVNLVVESLTNAGIAQKVVRLKPLIVIKG